MALLQPEWHFQPLQLRVFVRFTPYLAWIHRKCKLNLAEIFYLCFVLKRTLSIFIILQLLTNHEAFAELIKVPFLFHHYSESEENESILHFLKDHYADNSHEKSDHDHGKLPFKHSDDGSSHHPLPNISPVTKTENNYLINLTAFNKNKYRLTNDNIYSSYIDSIWQPPKLA